MRKKTSSASTKITRGLGVAALAAAAAATYYFSSAEGKKNLKKARAWTESAKKDMVAKIQDMKNFSEKAYQQAAKEVMAKYKQAKNIDPKEVMAFGAELKQHWESIAKHAAEVVAPKKGPAKKRAAK